MTVAVREYFPVLEREFAGMLLLKVRCILSCTACRVGRGLNGSVTKIDQLSIVRPQSMCRLAVQGGAKMPGGVMKITSASLGYAPCSSASFQVSVSNDLISRHATFHRDALMAYQRAEDGPKKDTAGLQLSIAGSSAMRGHEVDFLLAIHRAMRALEYTKAE